MKPRLLPAMLLCACAALAADKPAALQLCLQLPDGLQLFAAPRDQSREVGNDTWMLDFDVLLDGHPPTRITRSGPDCLRAWLPAEHLERITLDFSRLPLNLTNQDRAIDLQLKADLWSDGGKFTIARAPWSTVASSLGGALVFERQASAGLRELRDLQRLPSGKYVVKYTPQAATKSTCPVTLAAIGTGTVRADRNEGLFRELVEAYRRDVLPAVIAKHKLLCEPAEAAQVVVRIFDGVYLTPFEPAIVRVRVPEKEPRYQLVVDGKARPFESGQTLELGFGQHLEFSLVP